MACTGSLGAVCGPRGIRKIREIRSGYIRGNSGRECDEGVELSASCAKLAGLLMLFSLNTDGVWGCLGVHGFGCGFVVLVGLVLVSVPTATEGCSIAKSASFGMMF